MKGRPDEGNRRDESVWGGGPRGTPRDEPGFRTKISPGGKDQRNQTRKKMARDGESPEGLLLRGNHGQENQVRGTHPFFLQTRKPRPDQRSGGPSPASTMAKSISPRSTSAFRSLRRWRSPRANLLFRTSPTHSPRSDRKSVV